VFGEFLLLALIVPNVATDRLPIDAVV
jgi:hypothetical protein